MSLHEGLLAALDNERIERIRSEHTLITESFEDGTATSCENCQNENDGPCDALFLVGEIDFLVGR